MVTAVSAAQIVDIPDANFKAALLAHDPIIDTNGDGEIQVAEAANFSTQLLVGQENISDLTGIESFVNLGSLLCAGNNLTYLDLSPLTQLGMLQCAANDLETLIIENNPLLNFANIGGNPYSELVLPASGSLTALYVDNSGLESLDISGQSGLFVFAASGNNFESFDFTNNVAMRYIYFNDNSITEIDVSNCPSLEHLYLMNNPISSLDVSSNSNINTLQVSNTGLNVLDLSAIDDLQFVFANDNDLFQLNAKNGNNIILIGLEAANNPNLDCIQVDDEVMANNGEGVYGDWVTDSGVVYSEDCPILGVDSFLDSTLQLYPNPIQDVLMVESKFPIEKVSIWSATGELHYKGISNTNIIAVPVSELASGIYFVEIRKGANSRIFKVVKK